MLIFLAAALVRSARRREKYDREDSNMKPHLRAFAAAVSLAIAASAGPALAQKSGGVLRLPHFDSPASMSILEEATRATLQPMMGVFNNLVLYDQQVEIGRASCRER